MSSNQLPPVIRIELEYMAQRVTHALMSRSDEINTLVEQEVYKALNNFQFANEVRTVVESVLRQEIRNYFESGDGRRAIRSAVVNALALSAEDTTPSP